MTDRTKANMAAAKMLGKEGKTHSSYCEMCDDSFLCDGLTTVCPTCLEPCCDPKVYFDIFTNPSDCLYAVKCLLERNIVIGAYYPDGVTQKVGWFDWMALECKGSFDTYEEAVGAACIEVMEEE